MPSIVTHHLFAEDVLKNVKQKLNKKTYYIFAQSFDNLFYYSLFIPFKGKNIRTLGTTGHRKYINNYFLNILNYMKENNLTNNEELLGYLYGSICHYALDSTAHPFIVYYTGLPKFGPKYYGGHEKMEVMIDALIYKEKTKKNLKDAKLADTLLPKIKFSIDLKNCLNYVFDTTFNEKNMGNIYEKSYKTGNFIIKYFVTDHIGLKRQLYKIVDLFSTKKYEYLNFYITKLEDKYLNKKHELWNYPVDIKMTYSLSFYDLYDKALNTAINLINISNLYMQNKISKEELFTNFGDKSYTTGIDWQSPKEAKYFKF